MENIGNEKMFQDLIMEWLDERRDYIKESTYASYASIVYNHLIPRLGHYKINDISNRVVQRFITDMYRGGRVDNRGGLSNKTIKDATTIVKLALKKAMKDKEIEFIDLDFNYPRGRFNSKVKCFAKYEQRKIIMYCLDTLSLRNMGIVLCLYTGMRIGEVCALRWEDISFSKNMLYVNKTLQRIYNKETGKTKIIVTNPKTKNANREIPLNKDFVKLLRMFKSENSNYVLTNRADKCMEPRCFRKYYYKVIEEAEVSQIPFHSLRHTFASNCIRLGIDYKTVSELLGHASVNITLNIYVHPQMSEKRRCANLIYKENIDLFIKAYENHKYLKR